MGITEQAKTIAAFDLTPWPGVKLYDFGSNVTTMPIPDPGGNGWLQTSMCYLHLEGTSKFFGVAFDSKTTSGELKKNLRMAAEALTTLKT